MQHKFKGPFHQSHIADYCTCPKFFWLKEIMGMYPKTTTVSMFFGTVMHRAMAKIHEMNKLVDVHFKSDVEWAFFLNSLITECEKETEQGYDDHPPCKVEWKDKPVEIGKWIPDAIETLKIYWSKSFNRNANILLSEAKFTVNIGGFPFAGRLDQLREMPDGTKGIIDYKTGKSEVSEMLLEIGYQLSIYYYACEHGTFEGHGEINIRPDFVAFYRTMDHLPYKKNGKTKTKTYQKGDERGPGLYLATRTETDIKAMIQDLGIVCRNIKGPHFDNIKNQLAAGGAFGRMPSYVYGQVACDACSLKTECAAERRQAQGDTKEMENIITEEDVNYAEAKH